MPPLVIHKGSKMFDLWLLNKPPNVTLRSSPKGWINKQVFCEYAQNWIRWLKRHEGLSAERKHLLILDTHKSHIYNLQFLTLMTSNNIEVLAIPRHTSHILQPFDSIPFANFKTAWNANLSNYLFQNTGVGMPKSDFWPPFLPAWRKSMTIASIQSGF